MSLLSSLARRAAPAGRRRDRRRTACRRRASSAAAGSRSSRRTPSSRCRDGALVPSLTAPNIHDRAGGRRRARPACSSGSGRPRRIGLVVPDPVAKVSLVRFEQVPARAQDLDQLVRWQVQQDGAVPDRGGAGQLRAGRPRRRRPGVRRVARAARRRSRSTRALCAEAGAHAGLVDLATFNVVNAVLAGAAPPAGDWLLVNVAPDYASIAILRGAAPDLLPQPRRRRPTARSPIWCTRRRCTTRIGCRAAASAAWCWPARRRRRRSRRRRRAAFAAASRSGSARPVETVDPRTAAALTDRIAAAPALLDTLRRSSACCCADGRRPRDPDQPLDAAVLQRARRPARGCWRSRARASRRTVFNVVARPALLAQRHASWRRRRRATRRARPSCAPQAARLRASVDPKQIDVASVDARQANDLIDRRTFSWTELFNRFETTLPDDVRITSCGRKLDAEARHRPDDHRRRPRASTTSTSSWRTSRRPARSRSSADARGTRQRDRTSSQATLETVYAPAAATPPAAARGRPAMTLLEAHPRREARAWSSRSLLGAARQRRGVRARRVSAAASKSAGAADRAAAAAASAAGRRARAWRRPRALVAGKARAERGAGDVLRQGAAGRLATPRGA